MRRSGRGTAPATADEQVPAAIHTASQARYRWLNPRAQKAFR
jgi:hypothetical protein